MVTTYLKVSISIKKEDEEKYNQFLDIAKKDPKFQVKRNKGTTKEPKEVEEFIGVSSVLNQFWKFYLKKKIESENGIK